MVECVQLEGVMGLRVCPMYVCIDARAHVCKCVHMTIWLQFFLLLFVRLYVCQQTDNDDNHL